MSGLGRSQPLNIAPSILRVVLGLAGLIFTGDLFAQGESASMRIASFSTEWSSASDFEAIYSLQGKFLKDKDNAGLDLQRIEVHSESAGAEIWLWWKFEFEPRIHRLKELKSKKLEVREVWHEFFGFIHGRTGAVPPDEWKLFFRTGSIPDGNGDFNGTVDAANRKIHLDAQTPFGTFFVTVENSIEDGELKFVAEDGNEWRAKLSSLDAFPNGNFNGRPYSTAWFSLSCYQKHVVYWGINTQGVAYYLVFDLSTGKLLDKCFLHLVDRIYRDDLPKSRKKKRQ